MDSEDIIILILVSLIIYMLFKLFNKHNIKLAPSTHFNKCTYKPHHNTNQFIPGKYNQNALTSNINTHVPLNNNYCNNQNNECLGINSNNTNYLNIPIDTNVVQTSHDDNNVYNADIHDLSLENDYEHRTEYNAPVNYELTNPLDENKINVPDKNSTHYEDYYDNEPLYMNI